MAELQRCCGYLTGVGAGILRAAPASMQQQQPMLRRHSWSTHGLRNALNAMQQPAGGIQASPSLPATPVGGTEGGPRHAFAAPGGFPSPSQERGCYLNRLATHVEADEVSRLSGPISQLLSQSHLFKPSRADHLTDSLRQKHHIQLFTDIDTRSVYEKNDILIDT